MAGPLTWREVTAPNFSGTLDGYRVAGNALDRAFGGLSEGLGKFNEYNQGQNGAALMANALQYTDPKSLAAAIGNGDIFKGVDKGSLSLDALKALDNHASTLLNQATGQQNLDYRKGLDPLLVTHQAGENTSLGLQNDRYGQETAPLVQQIKLGNMGTVQQQDRYGQETPAAVEEGKLRVGQTKQEISMKGYGFGRKVGFDQADEAGQALADEAAKRSMPGDRRGMLDYLESKPGLDPKVKAAAQSVIMGGVGYGSAAPGGNAGYGGGGGGGGGGGASGVGAALGSAVAGGGAGDGGGAPPLSPGTSAPEGGLPGTSSFISSIPDNRVRASVSNVINDVGDTSNVTDNAAKSDLLYGSIKKQGITGFDNATGTDKANKAVLRDLLDRYHGNAELAIAAYTSGPANADKLVALHPDVVQKEQIGFNSRVQKALDDTTLRIGQDNAGGSDMYSQAMRDKSTNAGDIFAALKEGMPDPNGKPGANAKVKGPFSDLDPRAITLGIQHVKDTAAALKVPMNDATAFRLINDYGIPQAGSKIGSFAGAIGSVGGLIDNSAKDWGSDAIGFRPGLEAKIKSLGDSAGINAQYQGSQATQVLAKAVNDDQKVYNAATSKLLSLQDIARRPGRAEGVQSQISQALADKNRAAALLDQHLKMIESNASAKPKFTDPEQGKPSPTAAAALKQAIEEQVQLTPTKFKKLPDILQAVGGN